jgi:hypothetical protein
MHRRLRRLAAWPLCCLGAVAAAGCVEDDLPREEYTEQAAAPSGRFDRTAAGTVRGRVLWDGEAPDVPALQVFPNSLLRPPLDRHHVVPNPNAPAVDRHTGGLVGAVVFLKEVQPGHARPWDHPPVSVEQSRHGLTVVQGDRTGRVGFVRRGDKVSFVAKDALYHSLRATGANYFTLPFPDADRPSARVLDTEGCVELSSAVGYFWLRGYLFVSDHPYFTLSDARGRFTLRDVPAGTYELVCWLPSWQEARRDRDPETGLTTRLYYRSPAVREMRITVAAGADTSAGFIFSPSESE